MRSEPVRGATWFRDACSPKMLEQALRRYQNRAIETAKVIEELIQLAKDMRKAEERGEELGAQ